MDYTKYAWTEGSQSPIDNTDHVIWLGSDGDQKIACIGYSMSDGLFGYGSSHVEAVEKLLEILKDQESATSNPDKDKDLVSV